MDPFEAELWRSKFEARLMHEHDPQEMARPERQRAVERKRMGEEDERSAQHRRWQRSVKLW